MKKIFSLLAVALIAASVSAQSLLSASWDFIGDSTTTAANPSVALQDSLIACDTLVQNGIYAFYYGADVATKPLQKAMDTGLYWRRSNGTDRAIVLTVPGASKATVKLAVRPAKTNNAYKFYIFAKDSGSAITSKFHSDWTLAMDSLDWQYAAYTVDTLTFNVDLMDKAGAQDLYILYVDVANAKDNRLRGLSYQQTEVATPTDPTALTDEKQPAVAVKKMVNGQMVIYRDGKEYNILGAEL